MYVNTQIVYANLTTYFRKIKYYNILVSRYSFTGDTSISSEHFWKIMESHFEHLLFIVCIYYLLYFEHLLSIV